MHASWTVRTPPSGGVFGRNILLQRITCIAFASRPAFFHHIDCSKPKTIKDLSSAQSIEKFVFPSITRHLDFNLMLWIVHLIYLFFQLISSSFAPVYSSVRLSSLFAQVVFFIEHQYGDPAPPHAYLRRPPSFPAQRLTRRDQAPCCLHCSPGSPTTWLWQSSPTGRPARLPRAISRPADHR